MKSALKFSLALVAAIVLLGESAATAQMGPGPGARMYDPATEITVSGTVEQVQKDAKPFQSDAVENRRYGRDPHLVLTLKTRMGRYTVLVGPTWYAEDQRFMFSEGDSIKVTGSKLKSDDGVTIVAREIHRQGRTLTLRNASGIPEWSMSRQR
jgi:hypothetical protein